MSIFNRVPTKPTGSMKKRFRPVNTMSFDFGKIYPIFCKNVMPGDSWSMRLSSFLRTMPLICPVMSRNDIKVDAFYVPYRIIWRSAEEWFACNEAIRRPKISVKDPGVYDALFGPGSLVDYLGFGTPSKADMDALNLAISDRKIDAMPLRAYRLIYDYYFRAKSIEDTPTDILAAGDIDFYGDEDLVVDGVAIPNPNPLATALYECCVIGSRSWRRDIFTSALPDPQNGPDVMIPQADMDVVADGNLLLKNGPLGTADSEILSIGQTGQLFRRTNISVQDSAQAYSGGIKVTPENIPTMRKLRAANLMEEFEEAMARIGFSESTFNTGKFKEWLRGIWNVRSSDARLDIPEWLGGYRGPVTISEVLQTSVSTQDSPQGNMAGRGISAGGARIFRKKFFEEPGILMVTVSVVPKTAYCQGDPREWLYESGFDYPNPYFEGLGEQEVKKRELNCLADLLHPQDSTTFGYNVRNYEMKSYPDEIHGKFRTDLAFWHEGRLFNWDNVPGLNVSFLKVHPSDVSRIFPDTETSDKLAAQFFFDIVIKRRLNPYGLPSFSNF